MNENFSKYVCAYSLKYTKTICFPHPVLVIILRAQVYYGSDKEGNAGKSP